MKLVALFLLVSLSFAQSGRVTETDGFNNGYLWEESSAEEKGVYVTGIGDGVVLQSTMAASKAGATPDSSLYPKGFLIVDIVQGMDAFYQDRTNMKVPVIFAYWYVITKIRGASPEELDTMASKLRRRANSNK